MYIASVLSSGLCPFGYQIDLGANSSSTYQLWYFDQVNSFQTYFPHLRRRIMLTSQYYCELNEILNIRILRHHSKYLLTIQQTVDPFSTPPLKFTFLIKVEQFSNSSQMQYKKGRTTIQKTWSQSVTGPNHLCDFQQIIHHLQPLVLQL